LNQTFTDFEFIIIDDCSTDNSWEIIQEFAKKDEKIGVCGSNFWIIDSNGKILKEKTFPETEKEAKNAIWLRNPFAHNTVIFRKSCYEEFG